MPSIEIITRPRRQIRVLNGPAAGTVFILDGSLHIGRGEGVDILLMDDNVSRRHAAIVEDDDGEHALVDLDSYNGTFIDGQKVRWLTLRPGMIFEITRTKLLYEDGRPFSMPRRPLPMRRHDDLRAARSTMPHQAANSPDLQPPGSVLCAVDDRGIAYGGDLVADVQEFRRLLAQMSCGRAEAGPLLERFEQLESRFQCPGGFARSSRLDRYRRFFCSVPTRVCSPEANDIPVVMIDFGPGGAQLFSHGRRLPIDSVLWLLLDVEREGRTQTLTFPGHVEASNTDYAELSFTGEPTPLLREPDARPILPRPWPPAASEIQPGSSR